MKTRGLLFLGLVCTACPSASSSGFDGWFNAKDGSTTIAPMPMVMTENGRMIQAAPSVTPSTAAAVPAVAPQSGVRAFPGAEGFGAMTTGGRGGRVIYVTTLAASGPGSLTAALEADGPRYVVFKVSGLIDASPRIAKGDVTIAGQTSPGGIIVRGIHTDESNFCDSVCGAGVRGVDNIILRHIRTRPSVPGDNQLVDGDALRIRHSRNVVIDHVSSENAVDEAVEISYTNHLTIQDSILGETLGEHAERGGMLMNYSNPASGYELDAISILRTVWVRAQGRYPELSRESTAAIGTTFHIELANNLLWDQWYYVDVGQGAGPPTGRPGVAFMEMNWVGNVSMARSTYRYGMINFGQAMGSTAAYFHDNRINLYPDRADWQLNYCCNDYRSSPVPTAPQWARETRHDFPAVTYLRADQVRPYVLAHAGAFPRDPMDRRLMGYVASGMIPESAPLSNPAGDVWRTDWPAGSPPAAPVDTDSDGMPDEWERAHGLNPMTQDHTGMTVGQGMPALAGYNNLEIYLHEVSERRLTEGPWGR